MSDIEKNQLILEAKMQTKALQRLGVWKRAALSLAAIGILLIYTGFFMETNILRGVLGILITAVFGSAARFIQVGRRHGIKNVENILKLVTST